MKKLKLNEMTPRQALKITHILLYGGLAMAFLSVPVGGAFGHAAVMAILGAIGLSCAAAGIIFGNLRVRCPECGGSLTHGGRIPNSLFEYCPHCGKQIR